MGTITGSDFAEDPHPRQLSKRGWSLLGVTSLIFVVIYGLVVAFYSAEGGSSFKSSASATASGIDINFEPVGVNPETGNASFRLVMSSNDAGVSDQNNRAVGNIRVTVSGPDGTQEIRIPQGTSFGRAEVVLGISGEPAQYPVDAYSGTYFVNADFYDRQSGGANESKGEIPVNLDSSGAVNGWDSALTVAETGNATVILSAEFSRAFSTKLFALVLVALATIVSLLALFISILVLSNRRRVEAALLAWTGGLLFALPILRSYLPGAPPIGAAIDIYVFLWTVVMAFIAVFFIAVSWVGQRGAELEAVHVQEEVSTNAT